MVRLAETTGDRTLIWPSWCNGIDEVPYELFAAASHASYVLAASATLMEEEQPPQWMWAFDTEISTHFERVKRERDKKYKRKSGDDDEAPGEWKQNELAANLRRD